MKWTSNSSFATRVCSICGEHIGGGVGSVDHTECSKEKQRLSLGRKVKKRAITLSKKQIDYLSHIDK